MSERSRKVIEDLKISMAYGIDVALDGDLISGYAKRGGHLKEKTSW